MTISQLRTLCWRNLQILSLRCSRNSAWFCHAGQVGRREDRNHHRQYPAPWRWRISASGATQSVLRTQQQHFSNIKNLWGSKKKPQTKAALPAGRCLLGVPCPPTLPSDPAPAGTHPRMQGRQLGMGPGETGRMGGKGCGRQLCPCAGSGTGLGHGAGSTRAMGQAVPRLGGCSTEGVGLLLL